MLLIIVGFYVLLKYTMPLINPGRWQQAKREQPIIAVSPVISLEQIYNLLVCDTQSTL